ncbi:hypothetical protein TGDOM2_400360 [Toxoplasma gondii GAB2-2007-GAL-DOM2]|uniref:Uncharacterized protein n=1 Tax=Toxoplasma gondii GAB2-2007-GAL-DOM2 TaxID=1130820 RepID=A0A086JSR3_TOXGO|nr:hypothetical protein TGDOM2_400360 [Toxoplasma gondii GAB2-2007-GAL-DOM2]
MARNVPVDAVRLEDAGRGGGGRRGEKVDEQVEGGEVSVGRALDLVRLAETRGCVPGGAPVEWLSWEISQKHMSSGAGCVRAADERETVLALHAWRPEEAVLRADQRACDPRVRGPGGGPVHGDWVAARRIEKILPGDRALGASVVERLRPSADQLNDPFVLGKWLTLVGLVVGHIDSNIISLQTHQLIDSNIISLQTCRHLYSVYLLRSTPQYIYSVYLFINASTCLHWFPLSNATNRPTYLLLVTATARDTYSVPGTF